jgi:flagellar basal body-associated protein FliL
MAASTAVSESAAPAKGKSKLMMIGGIAVVVLALAYVFVLKPSPAPPAEAEHAEPVAGEVVDVGQMTVNLADPDRFARVSFAVVLVEGAVVGGGHGGGPGVEAKFPLIKEAVLLEFSKMTSDQLRAPGGLDAISKIVSERAKALYEHGEVMRVVFTELLVQ